MTGAAAADPFLSLRAISRSFGGVQALDGVSLDVRPGEVHCLAGENGSGKSTLIKVIAGVVRPDAGAIRVGGRDLAHLTPMASVAAGIQVIFQDLSLFPNLTVAENLALNTLVEHRSRLVRRRDVLAIARRAIAPLGVELDLDRPLGELPMAQRQLVAIGRALVQDARLVILDEPTTALTMVEVASLFATLRRLTSAGVAVLFVSHKIREMLDISDRLTVLRNGSVVLTSPAADLNDPDVARAMTGRTVTGAAPRRSAAAAVPILSVHGLSDSKKQAGPLFTKFVKRGPACFFDVHLQVRAGEVVGMTGLLGAGQNDLALAIVGARPASGEIVVDGQPRQIRNIRDAMRAGIAYLPEDRLQQGLFLDQSVERNITASSLRRLRAGAGLLAPSRLAAEARRWSERLSLKFDSSADPVSTLSGGNQQRVVLSRCLATSPRLLVLNGPTVGVDVGAKLALHRTIRALADDGIGVLMVSDDLGELAEHCDRVLVFRRGAIAAELSGARLTEDALGLELAHRL